ncbi:MAG: Zn-dependent dipeptidase, microsomal dipeptidase [Isosphaeraceae bacterium]
MSRRRPPPPRLVDLHIPWMLQYVGETTQNDPADYPPMAPRLGQVSGYLNTARAAFIPAARSARDWDRQADPWAALGLSIARIEAEFPGRILADRGDFGRWRDDPEGLTWAVLGIAGFDSIAREANDLDRLPGLVTRGARLFRPVERPGGSMGGAGFEGDDRGLTPLGADFLAALRQSAPEEGALLVDLSPMSPACRRDALDWFESDGSRADRLLPIFSPISIDPERPGSLDEDGLRRLRALGGCLGLGAGLPYHDSSEDLRRSLERAAEFPFQGEPGPRGIGIATDFLGRDTVAEGLETAEAIARWLAGAFDAGRASAWGRGNGEEFIARICGA